MKKKYYIICTGEHGGIIFKSQSDNADTLIKRYEKAAYSDSGNMYQQFYFCTMETNITDKMWYDHQYK